MAKNNGNGKAAYGVNKSLATAVPKEPTGGIGYQGEKREKRVKTKGELKEALQADPTVEYKASRFNFFGELFVQNLPLWRLFTGRMMLSSDPIVSFSMNIRNAALMAAEIEVKGSNPKVVEWVKKQWNYVWNYHRISMVSAKEFGFAPLQIKWKADEKGILNINGIKDFAPEDCRGMEKSGTLIGQRVKGEPLYFPHALWLSFSSSPTYGNPYGSPITRRQYPAWFEKWMERGAKRLQQLRMIKDAYIGDIFWYPPDLLVEIPDPNGGTKKVSWRDLVRGIGENRMSGGMMALPMKLDSNGKKLVEYQPPTAIPGSTEIFNWVEYCDDNILKGGDIPLEVVEASSTGSGFSGRSIPFLVLLSVCNGEFTQIVRQTDERGLRPVARLNFGGDPDYEIKPKNLVETFGSDIQGSSLAGGSIGGPVGQPPPGGQGVPQAVQQQYAESHHPSEISDEHVGHILASQHHHVLAREKEKEFGALANTTRHEAPFLQDRYVHSKRFVLKEIPIHSVHPIVPPVEGTKSHSTEPIIVDKNKGSFGRLHGHFGAPPDNVIIDGKHRHAEALARGEKTIKAYVGENSSLHHSQHSEPSTSPQEPEEDEDEEVTDSQYAEKVELHHLRDAIARRNVEPDGRVWHGGALVNATPEVVKAKLANSQLKQRKEQLNKLIEGKKKFNGPPGSHHETHAVRALLPSDSRAATFDEAIADHHARVRDSEHYEKDTKLAGEYHRSQHSQHSQHSEQFDESYLSKLRALIGRGLEAAKNRVGGVARYVRQLDPTQSLQSLADLIEGQIRKLTPLLGADLFADAFPSHVGGSLDVLSRLPPTETPESEKAPVEAPIASQTTFPILPILPEPIVPGATVKPPETPKPVEPELAEILFPKGVEIEPEVHLPAIEQAVEALKKSPVATGSNYLETAQKVKEGSFAITADMTDKAVADVRDQLAKVIEEGKPQKEFIEVVSKRLEEEGSPLSPPHLENIWRTNTMAAYSKAQFDAVQHPLVADAFPYVMRSATKDARVRPDHWAMESLGLNGTNIYSVDDPEWARLRAPFDYMCRCRDTYITVEQAAKKGVREAQDWLSRAKEIAKTQGGSFHQYLFQSSPVKREWVEPIKIEPSPGFQRDMITEG